MPWRRDSCVGPLEKHPGGGAGGDGTHQDDHGAAVCCLLHLSAVLYTYFLAPAPHPFTSAPPTFAGPSGTLLSHSLSSPRPLTSMLKGTWLILLHLSVYVCLIARLRLYTNLGMMKDLVKNICASFPVIVFYFQADFF